jgi:hypothetical protein
MLNSFAEQKKEKDYGHEIKNCCYRSHRGPELRLAGARPIVQPQ